MLVYLYRLMTLININVQFDEKDVDRIDKQSKLLYGIENRAQLVRAAVISKLNEWESVKPK